MEDLFQEAILRLWITSTSPLCPVTCSTSYQEEFLSEDRFFSIKSIPSPARESFFLSSIKDNLLPGLICFLRRSHTDRLHDHSICFSTSNISLWIKSLSGTAYNIIFQSRLYYRLYPARFTNTNISIEILILCWWYEWYILSCYFLHFNCNTNYLFSWCGILVAIICFILLFDDKSLTKDTIFEKSKCTTIRPY